MAGRYGRQQTERSLSESTFFTAVSRLETLCMSADSLTVRGDGLVRSSCAGNEVYLYREGDCLVVLFGEGDDCIPVLRDTLFRNVDDVRWTSESDVPKRIDSLYVLLQLANIGKNSDSVVLIAVRNGGEKFFRQKRTGKRSIKVFI